MKRLLFVLVTLSLIVVGSSLALAEAQGQNELGLYYDQNDLTSNSHSDNVQPFETLHLILQNPYLNVNEDHEIFVGTTPALNITGIEFKIVIPAGQMAYYTPPVEATNIGTFPNFVLGFHEPVLAVGSQVILGSLTCVGINTNEISNYYLNPVDLMPSLEGHLAAASKISELNHDLIAVFPVSGSHSDPVFVFSGAAPVATEHESWGGVKALYR